MASEGEGHVSRDAGRSGDWRLRYEPCRRLYDAWSFRLHVERLAADGEWEPVHTADLHAEDASVFANPDRFITFERRTAKAVGLDRRHLPIVDEPCPLLSCKIRRPA